MVDEYYIEGMRFKIVLYEGSEAMKSSSVHIQAFLPFRTLVVYGQEFQSVILLKEVEVALPVICSGYINVVSGQILATALTNAFEQLGPPSISSR